jgi:hypothetical protein
LFIVLNIVLKFIFLFLRRAYLALVTHF